MSHEPRRIAQQGSFMHQITGGAAGNRHLTEENITDNLEELLEILPPDVRLSLEGQESLEGLLEVIMDLGRMPEARFPKQVLHPLDRVVTYEDIEYVVSRVGSFGDDNRAGIERTLHRISAIRNRRGEVIGLTCRVGRAVQGTIDVVRDLVESGRSILIMGRPGVGKTTKLREIARILSDDMHRRVIVIDTSNEIAGDGDIPHPAIGGSRRMQVPRTEMQHAVMIEAVENHMPEVIVIDEISTQAEALAARTIAERGVQLIGTAHGNSIENLVMNPSLNDLIGGIQSVTLGDEEAKRRGTQKTVLERKAPPTFDIAIEIQDRYRLAVHQDVSEVVDQLLRGYPPNPEIRAVDEHTGDIHIVHEPQMDLSDQAEKIIGEPGAMIHIYPYAVSRSQLERVIRTLRIPATVTKELDEADSLMILKSYAKSGAKIIEAAELRQIPVYIVKSNTIPQIQKTLREVMHLDSGIAEEEEDALQEARTAIESMAASTQPVELAPRSAFIRRMQHQLVEQYHLRSDSTGTEPNRRIRIYPRGLMGGA